MEDTKPIAITEELMEGLYRLMESRSKTIAEIEYAQLKGKIFTHQFEKALEEHMNNIIDFGQSVVHLPTLTTGVTIEEVQNKLNATSTVQ